MTSNDAQGWQRAPDGGAAPAKQFVTFTIGAEEYGVDIMMVREIKGWSHTTTLPNSPPHVRGVINLRGIIVPIFDLRMRFGMGLTEPSATHVVIIVKVGTRTIGLLADGVSDIISVDLGAIRPVPELGHVGKERFLEGLVAFEERMVTLVLLDGLFDVQASWPGGIEQPPPVAN